MQFDLPKELSSIIKVIGVGGGGSNAVNHMYRQGIKGVDFIVCNTDRQALDTSPVQFKIQLGNNLTQGLGAGMLPEVGKNAALESLEEIKKAIGPNTKMVFITAGMGKGTGTGATPIIAKAAREMGILTVAIVTIPFNFEGPKKRKQAESGIEELKKHVDTLLVICNERLREMYGNLSVVNAFSHADNVLSGAARSIAEIISNTLHVNVDFNDVNTVMKDSGVAIMGTASASGDGRAINAVEMALNSPLLNDNEINGAKYVLMNVTSGTEEITMDELGEITDYIQTAAGEDAEIVTGYGIDPELKDKVNVTIIATGFKSKEIPGIDTSSKSEKKLLVLEDNINPVKEEKVIVVEQVKEETPVIDELEPVLKIKEPVVAEAQPEPVSQTEDLTSIEDEVVVSDEIIEEEVPFEYQVAPPTEIEAQSEIESTFQLFNEVFDESEVTESTDEIESDFEETFIAEEKLDVESISSVEAAVPEINSIDEQEIVTNDLTEVESSVTPLVVETTFEITDEVSVEPVTDEIEEATVSNIEEPEYIAPVQATEVAEVKEEITAEITTPIVEETVQPVSNAKPEIISEPKIVAETPKPEAVLPKTDNPNNEEQIRKAQERIMRLKELSLKLKTPDGIAELENEPAYVRRNIQLQNTSHSSESDVSRFTLGEGEDNKTEIRPNNSFLHDNVD